LHVHLNSLPWLISGPVMTLTLLSVFVAAYHFFNMVMVNIYQCLLRDVVPTELMARFLAMFRVVGTAGTFVFLWYLFPQIIAHRQVLCAGIGALYVAAFLLMCWRVKEGEYPPPPAEKEKTSYARSFIAYFRESLSVPLYRNFLIMYALVITASASA